LLPGNAPIPAGNFQLGDLGYAEREYLVTGTATSFAIEGERTRDGRWTARPDTEAAYTTRIVVRAPTEAERFSGVVAVEWNNVSGGIDIGPDWMLLHRGLMDRGHAWVGVTAQKAGIDGGGIVEGLHLRVLDAARYADLDHPGDSWAYDIYSQVGEMLKSQVGEMLKKPDSPLAPLEPAHLIAVGESQSAAFLVTYINSIDPLAQVYDGFFVHGRPGMGAAMDGFARARSADLEALPAVLYESPERIRDDARVPVLVLQSETDVVSLGGGLPEQPDGPNLRLWELAGAAHADTYMLVAAFYDDGTLTPEDLATKLQPTTQVAMGTTATPVNSGPQQHYVGMAAFEHLARWVADGTPPPAAPRLKTTSNGGGQALEISELGLAEGGIRTPWVEAPLSRLSGLGQEGDTFAFLFGRTEPLATDDLRRLYPGGKSDYLRRFEAALDLAIESGWIRATDRPEIVAVAGASYDLQVNPG
ncbi:MAG TPA: alpha/beta hydrolase domain-containing protein, partial [Acidimicrobiales bacterium]|nr:alpha/beta hydrolase domain-containing protein [Acidimicrobiales bacterium]